MRVIKLLTTGGGLASLLILLTACPSQDIPSRPEQFYFASQVAEPGVAVTSNTVTIKGLSAPALASVSEGGTLLVDGVVAGTTTKIANLSSLAVTVTSSMNHGDTVEVTVNVGGTTATFAVTTREASISINTVPPNLNTAEPGQVVQLAWIVEGEFDALFLSSSADPTPQEVTSLLSTSVTIPSDQPQVTYTLTVERPGADDSENVTTGEIYVPLWVCSEATAPITFESETLEASVRGAAGITDASTPITCADVQGVLDVEVGSWQGEPGDVDSLVGLQHLVNLERLKAQFNEISDLTPVKGLGSLRVLDLDGNRVTDLSPISSLTNLEFLGFWDNGPVRFDERSTGADIEEYCYDGIRDISPLANLVNVRTIYLSCNAVEDLAPLADMEDLELLFVISNRLSNIEPLIGKPSLEILRFSDNGVATASGVLASLPNLTWLEMAYNRLRDSTLGELASLDNLYVIDLEGNFFSNLSPLIANGNFPAASGTGHEQEPVDPEIRIAYNCIADVPAVAAALQLKGVDVVDAAGPQRDPEDCIGGASYGIGLQHFRLQQQGR